MPTYDALLQRVYSRQVAPARSPIRTLSKISTSVLKLKIAHHKTPFNNIENSTTCGKSVGLLFLTTFVRNLFFSPLNIHQVCVTLKMDAQMHNTTSIFSKSGIALCTSYVINVYLGCSYSFTILIPANTFITNV
jgi:hypothetical protein